MSLRLISICSLNDVHWGLVIGPSPRPDNEYYRYLNYTKIEIYVPFWPDNEYGPIMSTTQYRISFWGVSLSGGPDKETPV